MLHSIIYRYKTRTMPNPRAIENRYLQMKRRRNVFFSLILELCNRVRLAERHCTRLNVDAMHFQRLFFKVFLVLYVLTGITLAVIAYLLYNTSHGYDRYGSHLSILARYYISIVAFYILVVAVIHVIISFCCKRKWFCFRITTIHLVVGMLMEITTVAVIVLMQNGMSADVRRNTSIVLTSLTGYLCILQLYGIIACLSCYSELRHSYEIVSPH
jgi:hypothetical protein